MPNSQVRKTAAFYYYIMWGFARLRCEKDNMAFSKRFFIARSGGILNFRHKPESLLFLRINFMFGRLAMFLEYFIALILFRFVFIF